MKHEELYEKTMKAIQELFSDTSVSQEETKVSLNTLIDEIEIMIDTLDI